MPGLAVAAPGDGLGIAGSASRTGLLVRAGGGRPETSMGAAAEADGLTGGGVGAGLPEEGIVAVLAVDFAAVSWRAASLRSLSSARMRSRDPET